MLEKRQAIRYRVGDGTDIVIFREGGNLVAPLVDLSCRGLMAAIPESESRRLSLGQEVSGQLRRNLGFTTWRGRVVHRSPGRSGIGIGIAFHSDDGSDVQGAVQEIVQQPDAGGLHLRRDDGLLALEVHGRLSFLTSRDALSYIRRNVVHCVDLAHCTSVDSAGLGMLSLAKERRIAIVGAHGSVRSLLEIARISDVPHPGSNPRTGLKH